MPEVAKPAAPAPVAAAPPAPAAPAKEAAMPGDQPQTPEQTVGEPGPKITETERAKPGVAAAPGEEPDYVRDAAKAVKEAIAARKKEEEAPAPVEVKPAAAVEVKPGDKPAEAKAEPPKPAAPQKSAEPLAKQYEKLATQNADLRKREEELRKREAAIAEDEALAAKDPDAFARKKGLSYERWTENILAKARGEAPKDAATEKPPAKAELPPEVAKELEESRKFRENYERQQTTAQRAKDIESIREFAKGKGDEYELALLTPGAVDEAYDLILKHHAATGELFGGSGEAASAWALGEIEKRELERGQRMLTAKKLRGTVSDVAPKPAVASPEESVGQKTVPRSLTNGQATPATPVEPETTDPDELRARAARVIAAQRVQ